MGMHYLVSNNMGKQAKKNLKKSLRVLLEISCFIILIFVLGGKNNKFKFNPYFCNM